MYFIKIVPFLLILMVNSLYAQEWIFEYKSEYDNFVNKSWEKTQNSNTLHSIVLSTVPQSDKDRRTRLIELDNNGEFVSLFKPKECNTLAFYQPYGQDSIISVSRRCDGQWINTFNIFNNSGKKVFTKEFENKRSGDRIIANDNGISILRTESGKNGRFHLLELSDNGEEKKYTFPYGDFKDEGYKIVPTQCIKLKSGDYLLSLNIYQPYNKSRKNDSYPKLLLINKEKVQWQQNYKSTLKKIKTILEIEGAYLIQGTDRENRHTIIVLDKDGNQTSLFHPESLHGSILPGIYASGNHLFTISTRIYGSTIHINQYDITTGEKTHHESIDTDYWRIFNLQIAALREDHFIITGGSIRSSDNRDSRGFVMKSMRQNISSPDEETVPEVITVEADKLIEETSEEVMSVKVFPNPATFAITFELEGGPSLDDMLLSIFSIEGALISSREFNGNHIEVDISSYPRGTYIYVVSDQKHKNTISGKFIAQ